MTQFKILLNPHGRVALHVARFVYNAFKFRKSQNYILVDNYICIYMYYMCIRYVYKLQVHVPY